MIWGRHNVGSKDGCQLGWPGACLHTRLLGLSRAWYTCVHLHQSTWLGRACAVTLAVACTAIRPAWKHQLCLVQRAWGVSECRLESTRCHCAQARTCIGIRRPTYSSMPAACLVDAVCGSPSKEPGAAVLLSVLCCCAKLALLGAWLARWPGTGSMSILVSTSLPPATLLSAQLSEANG